MIHEIVYYVATHKDLFRPGEPAIVKGIHMVRPSAKLEPRLCYHIEFMDGKEDWIPIKDRDRYFKLATLSQILNGVIPEIKSFKIN